MADNGKVRTVKGLIVLFVLAMALSTIAADLPASSISWSADRPLTWADYQAPPPAWATPPSTAGRTGTVTFTAAETYLYISWTQRAQASCSGTTVTARFVDVVVTNVMNPVLSWKLAAYATPQVLRHEQFHFNLHEVYRRLIQNTLSSLTMTRQLARPADCTYEASLACAQSLNDVANTAGSELLARAHAAHVAYDAETQGGMNAAAQATWEARITTWLATPTAAP